MRCTIRRLVIFFPAIIALIILLNILHDLKPGSKKSKYRALREGAPCEVSAEIKQNLRQLQVGVHSILKDLKLTHFLCYGSLWGAIRRNGPLPWEQDVEFCIRNEELMDIDEGFLYRSFRKKNFILQYDSQDGVYSVVNASGPDNGHVELVVFEKAEDVDVLKRVGWKRRLLPPNCEMSPSLTCFPSRLVERPLPTVTIAGVEYPVPREEAELLKYLYPDDWWIEVKPENCT